MKTYHMYHAETVSAETKLREAERQEGRVKGVTGSSGGGGGGEPVFGLRIEERHQRRNAARKMEKMREKVESSWRLSRSFGPVGGVMVRLLRVSSEEGQVLGEQAEDPEGSERVPADPGGHQRLRLQVLHPRPARHHRRERLFVTCVSEEEEALWSTPLILTGCLAASIEACWFETDSIGSFILKSLTWSWSVVQCCDLGYHSSLSRALRTYLSAELSLEASRRAGLEVLEGAVEGLDPARDRQRLLGLYPTAFCPPQRFGFQAHMGDTVSAASRGQRFS